MEYRINVLVLSSESKTIPPKRLVLEVQAKGTQESSPSTLISSTTRQNNSNELYAWQPTSNPNVASYFDLQAGLVHCTYLGAKTKAIANKLAIKVRNWFVGVSLEIRNGSRLDSKYELKVNGLQDKHIQWLVEQDFEAVDDWDYPEHLFPRATNLDKSLAASCNKPYLKKGIKVFNPKNNTKYILLSWGEMRAEVYDPHSNQNFMHYLTNLELTE